VAGLAKELGVSRQSLYYKPKLPAKDQKLKAAIEEVMDDHKAYGHKQIAIALIQRELPACKDGGVSKVQRLPKRSSGVMSSNKERKTLDKRSLSYDGTTSVRARGFINYKSKNFGN